MKRNWSGLGFKIAFLCTTRLIDGQACLILTAFWFHCESFFLCSTSVANGTHFIHSPHLTQRPIWSKYYHWGILRSCELGLGTLRISLPIIMVWTFYRVVKPTTSQLPCGQLFIAVSVEELPRSPIFDCDCLVSVPVPCQDVSGIEDWIVKLHYVRSQTTSAYLTTKRL